MLDALGDIDTRKRESLPWKRALSHDLMEDVMQPPTQAHPPSVSQAQCGDLRDHQTTSSRASGLRQRIENPLPEERCFAAT